MTNSLISSTNFIDQIFDFVVSRYWETKKKRSINAVDDDKEISIIRILMRKRKNLSD